MWDHIPKHEAQLMADVFAIENARASEQPAESKKRTNGTAPNGIVAFTNHYAKAVRDEIQGERRGAQIETPKEARHIYEAATNGAEQQLFAEVERELRELDIHVIEGLVRKRNTGLGSLALWYIRKTFYAEGREFPKGRILVIERERAGWKGSQSKHPDPSCAWGRTYTGYVKEDGKHAITKLGYLNADSIRPPGTEHLLPINTFADRFPEKR